MEPVGLDFINAASPPAIRRHSRTYSTSTKSAAAAATTTAAADAADATASAETMKRQQQQEALLKCSTMNTPLRQQYTGIPEMPFVDPDWAQHVIAFKIVLIGDAGVGKTSLFLNFLSGCNGTGPLQHAITPGADQQMIHILLSAATKTAIGLQIWDTAGQERFHTITTSYLRACHLVIFVYDVNNAASFENLKLYWWKQVQDHGNRVQQAKYVVVANKIDKYNDLIRNTGDVLTLPELKQKHMNELSLAFGIPFDNRTYHHVTARNGNNVDQLLMACKSLCADDSPAVERALIGDLERTNKPYVYDMPTIHVGAPNVLGKAKTTGTVASSSGCGC